jgi:hypothetical protein
MNRALLGTLLLVSTAAVADKAAPDKTPASNPTSQPSWPTGTLTIDKKASNDNYEGALSIIFTDADQKKHDIELSFNFTSAHISKCTFDDQVLDQVSQWRALSKYFTEHHFGDSRAINVLECTHPGADKANETNPDCKGWKDSAEDRADAIAKNGYPFDAARAAKVGVVLYIRYAADGGNSPSGKWAYQFIKVIKIIKNDPKADFSGPMVGIGVLAGQDSRLRLGEGTIYLEQTKDKSATFWSLLGGTADQGSSDWYH